MLSLRRRLLLILVGLFTLAWLVAFAGTYAAATRRIQLLFDAELAHDAGVLLTLAERGLQDARGRSAAPRAVPLGAGRFRKVLAFVIWRGERPVLRSENAPDVHPPAATGYDDLILDGNPWRGYTLRGPEGGLTVWVGEPFSLRGRLAQEIARDEVFPLLLVIPLLALLAWWGVGRGLLPLRRVAADVAQRSPSNLQPVGIADVPAELNTVIDRLNALLARLREAFDMERRFTSDAAHEIRTPLAGIKTHAQVALRATDDAQRRREMEQVIQGVDRTTHLVEQLLTLARLDREALAGGYVPVDLAALAGEIVQTLGQDAAARQIVLTLRDEGQGEVRGNAVALGVMIRNLVDNAIRYTPAGGRVEVRVAAEDGGTLLTVTDNGPGIPAADRPRVFDRFYRGTTANAYGCGLGLSIVRRVAELHRADVELADAPGGSGLQVRVTLAAG